MKHSIVTWDSTYRHFFHLIDGLLAQDYDRSEFELIYVEQRPRDYANRYTRSDGVDSLADRYEEVRDDINMTVHYMNERPPTPYHLGRILNAGIERAEGEYISVMDGDQLLPPDFLASLDDFFASGGTIANIIRRVAREPVGVDKKDWKDAEIEFEKCLDKCPEKGEPFPDETPNYGPLIGAHRRHWEAIRSYSTHPVWQSTMNRCHADVNTRLEIHTDEASRLLPDVVAVHPWHPPPPNRSLYTYRKLFHIHDQLIRWTKENRVSDWHDRTAFADRMYEKHERFFDRVVDAPELAVPGEADQSDGTPLDTVREELSMTYALAVFDGYSDALAHVSNTALRVVDRALPFDLNVTEPR